MVDNTYIRDRISSLRTKMGISEYKMSLDLGHSKSYIQSISSGKALPSLSEFLYICEYLGVTPKEFFDENDDEPVLTHTLLEVTRKMKPKDVEALIYIAERLTQK